ncbi:MAG: putative toxin-antitoxin system toxin component, PIN family [Candidatus Aminicenantes bacterium]|nr:putative toxin-antitoxin system toxin component, PIN family [Candidatus Aminicenantes bacterium]
MIKILRVVIDTNHIISAILSSRGASSKLIDWMTRADDYFKLLLSEPIWDEYNTVADWLTPFSRQPEKERIINALHTHADWIKPDFQLKACSDASDNYFLECAVAGNADYLVTKNIRHFPPKEYRNVKIVRVRKFLEALEKMEEERFSTTGR